MTREEIVRNLKYTMEKHKNDTVNTFETNISVMCKDILYYLEQEPKWIPVWERLPEKRGDYLVTQKATFTDYVYISVAGYALNLYDVDEYDFEDKKRSGWYNYDPEYGYYEIDDVIAWMPLVEPYKAESEEQE